MPAVDVTDIVLSHFASYPSFSPSVIFPQSRHRAIPLTTPSPGAVAYAQQTTDCTDSTRASALVDVIDPGRPPQQGNHATSSEALACVASHPVRQQSVVVVHSAAPIARSCNSSTQTHQQTSLTSFPSQLCCVRYSSSTANSRTYIRRCVPDAALNLVEFLDSPAAPNRFPLSGGVSIKRCIVCIYYSRLPREGRPHISS
jgi:hypothetical protein